MRRLLVRRFSEAGYAGKRRTSGRLLQYCPSGQSGSAWTIAGRETKGGHSPAAIPSRHSGGDWRENRRSRERVGIAKKCDREMLRWRYHSKAKVAGEAEGREKADESDRQGQYSARSFYRSAQDQLTSWLPRNTSPRVARWQRRPKDSSTIEKILRRRNSWRPCAPIWLSSKRR